MSRCYWCQTGEGHPFHSNGTINDGGTSYIPVAPVNQDTPLEAAFVHPVQAVFDEASRLVASKAHDYAAQDNVFSNFENTAEQTGITLDDVFHSHLVNKMERIRQLRSKGFAQHESMRDSLLDLANYACLWIAATDRGTLPTVAEAFDKAVSDLSDAAHLPEAVEALEEAADKSDAVMYDVDLTRQVEPGQEAWWFCDGDWQQPFNSDLAYYPCDSCEVRGRDVPTWSAS